MLPLAKGMVDRLKGRLLGQGDKNSDEQALPSTSALTGSASSEAVVPAGNEGGAGQPGGKQDTEGQKGEGSDTVSQKRIATALN